MASLRVIPRRVRALYNRARRRLREWLLSSLNAIDARQFASYFQEALDSYNVDVEGKVVVDIGADWGSSSLYFLARGARKVVAYDRLRPRLEVRGIEWNGLWSGDYVPGDILKVDCEGCECNADPSIFFRYETSLVAVHRFTPCFSALSSLLREHGCSKVYVTEDGWEEVYLCKKEKEME